MKESTKKWVAAKKSHICIGIKKKLAMVCGHPQMYLMKYGYMDGPGHGAKSAPLLSQDGLREYIREFQVCHFHYTTTDQG